MKLVITCSLLLATICLTPLAYAFEGAGNANATVISKNNSTSIYRLRIKHADPQLIYLLLKGRANFSTPPEISSLNLDRSNSG